MCFINPILQKKDKGKQTIQAASDNTEIEECYITNESVPNSAHLQPSQVPGTSHAVERDTTIQVIVTPSLVTMIQIRKIKIMQVWAIILLKKMLFKV